EERHLPKVAGEVGSADADAEDAHDRLARSRRGRLGHVDHTELLRLFELNGFHRSRGSWVGDRGSIPPAGGATACFSPHCYPRPTPHFIRPAVCEKSPAHFGERRLAGDKRPWVT